MENTSAVAMMAYPVEHWIFMGVQVQDISLKIAQAHIKEPKKWPSHMVFVDAFLHPISGASGCAFKDARTNEVSVGFAGTNALNGEVESWKDYISDASIGVRGLDPDGLYMQSALSFVTKLQKKGYNVSYISGHSLGGTLASLAGATLQIPHIVTYNSAPLYVLKSLESAAVQKEIRSVVRAYQGKAIRFVSNNDWLDQYASLLDAFFMGEKHTINNNAGHDMKAFLRADEQKFIKEVLSAAKTT